jgi:hypothetical protein
MRDTSEKRQGRIKERPKAARSLIFEEPSYFNLQLKFRRHKKLACKQFLISQHNANDLQHRQVVASAVAVEVCVGILCYSVRCTAVTCILGV